MAFGECTSLTSVTIPSSVTGIGSSAFSRTKWLDNQQKKNPQVVVNGILINAAKCSGKVTVLNSVKTIAIGAFEKNTSITSVTIPNGVTTIDDFAFDECVNLETIIIPDSVVNFGNYVFANCNNLTICCSGQSAARRYAERNNIAYKLID